MEDKLLLVLLQAIASVVVLTIGLTAWFCAGSVRQLSANESENTAGAAWYRIVGWLLMWIGALSLFATSIGAGSVAVVERELVTRSPAAILVAIVTMITLIIVIRATAGMRSWLLSLADDIPPEERGRLSALSSWRRGFFAPLTLMVLCVAATAVAAVLFEVGLLSTGMANTAEHSSVAFLLIALAAQTLTLIGLAVAISAEIITLPWGTVDARQRLLLSRVLSAVAVLAMVIALVAILVPGIIITILFGVLVVSTIGGRRRAAELSAFWTLSHAVKTGQPLAQELEAQAESALGRASYLLGATSQELAAGIPLEEAAFRRGLIPRSSWLEVRAGMSSGQLRESIAAAAQRETERFSRMSSAGPARISLAYFGALGGVLMVIISFLMYSIVPKFKKILEDFDMEVPPAMRSVLALFDSSELAMLLSVLGILVVIAALAVELLVDYYGWEGMLERFGSRYRLRFATPDMLRGLKWAVLGRQPLDRALEDMGATPVTFLVRTGLHRAAGGIRQGENPWDVLRNVGWIRSEEAELLRCAQAAGNLPWALETLSQSVSQRRSYRVEWWLQALHPVLVMIAGVFVGWFAIGMFSPLVSMLNGLS